MARRFNPLSGTGGYVRRALRLVWEGAPGWTAAWATLLVVQGLIPGALVLTTKWVIDALNASLGAGQSLDVAASVAPPLLVMGGLILTQQSLGGVLSWVTAAQSEHVSDHVTKLMHRKASEVDFAFYEAAEYHDLMEQAQGQGSSRVLQLLQNGGTLLQTAVTLSSIALILATYGLWVAVALFVSAVPVLVVVVRNNRAQHAWWKGATHRRRKAQYYGLLMTQAEAAAEVRINKLDRTLVDGYQEIRRGLRTERLTILRQHIVSRFGASVFSLLVTALAMGWVVWRAFAGAATIGDLAAFYQAFTQAQSISGAALSSVGALYSSTLFLRHLVEFLDLEREIVGPATPRAFPPEVREGVRFEGVTFAYPGTDRAVLDGLDLEVPAGKTVAVVGENGAGKSTFIKLLCRFYDPSAGRVTIDGVDIREYDPDDLRDHVSVLFQFPMKYQMAAADNVRIGGRGGDDPGRLDEAVRGAGADGLFERLPDKAETLLGRWFAGGVELSGGEWQRVALARAFYRRSPVVVLDEPTSFMDSWAENEWLDRFERVAGGQTVLVITHRFTTAMRADVIHVMESGRIVESGTHDELVALGGRYAASWRTQMRQATGDAPAVDGPTADVPAGDGPPGGEPALATGSARAAP